MSDKTMYPECGDCELAHGNLCYGGTYCPKEDHAKDLLADIERKAELEHKLMDDFFFTNFVHFPEDIKKMQPNLRFRCNCRSENVKMTGFSPSWYILECLDCGRKFRIECNEIEKAKAVRK